MLNNQLSQNLKVVGGLNWIIQITLTKLVSATNKLKLNKRRWVDSKLRSLPKPGLSNQLSQNLWLVGGGLNWIITIFNIYIIKLNLN